MKLSVLQGRTTPRRTDVSVVVANTFKTRLVGLLKHKRLDDNEALLIVPGESIHTIGMRFAIDVVFLDKENNVIGVADHVRPYRIRMAPKGVAKVLECSAGNRGRLGIDVGVALSFESE